MKFYVAGDLDGSAITNSTADDENTRLVDITSVDDEVKKMNLAGPFVLKLDTHGFEVPILEGALETLKKTELVIVEVYGFNITNTSLLFYELTAFLDNLGFRMVDIVDVMRRQKDGAFWQADAFYIKKDGPVFKDNSYS